ncbi:hypothetical protein [Tetragenococcus halophilus]|uniref:hypothetical protein n=2 Tax=Tetragenococcus halophilus TaxID=51669 RepID=UPI0030F463CF
MYINKKGDTIMKNLSFSIPVQPCEIPCLSGFFVCHFLKQAKRHRFYSGFPILTTWLVKIRRKKWSVDCFTGKEELCCELQRKLGV